MGPRPARLAIPLMGTGVVGGDIGLLYDDVNFIAYDDGGDVIIYADP